MLPVRFAFVVAVITALGLSGAALRAADCPTVPVNCRMDFNNEVHTYRIRGCTAGVQANWDGFSGRSERNSCIATVPSGTLLWDIDVHDVGLNNGTYTVSKLGSGLDFSYEREVRSIFDEAIDLSVKSGDDTKAADLKEKRDEYIKWVEKAKTNLDTVRIEVSASTQGSVVDRKGGHATATVDLIVACAGPTDAREQIGKAFQIMWPTSSPSDVHQVTFTNSGAVTAYLAINAGTIGLDCDAGARRTGNYTVAAKGSIAVSIADQQNVCFVWGSQIPRTSGPLKYCEAADHDSVDLAQRKDCQRT